MNVWTFNGRLTRDPELKQGRSGTDFCQISVAVESGFLENKKTVFPQVTFFGKSAQAIKKHFKKGDGINIVGEVEEIDTYETRNGEARAALKVIGQRFTFPQGKKGGGESGGSGQSRSYNREDRNESRSRDDYSNDHPNDDYGDSGGTDDDLPF